MNHERYQFGPEVPMDKVEGSLLMAVLSAESLYGETANPQEVMA
jgi:hypothetical protein